VQISRAVSNAHNGITLMRIDCYCFCIRGIILTNGAIGPSRASGNGSCS